MKRIGFIALPLLFAVGVAMADDMGKDGAAAQPEAAAASASEAAPSRMAGHVARRLPRGDIRHCLDMESNAAIIRCSETRRRK
jgi:hypothetical protein